jgi:hypothetical protein
MIKKDNRQNHNFSKLMMVLALGALIILPGIASCKKSRSNGVIYRQTYSGQNHPINPAPLPGTITLLGSGLAGLGLIGWSKRKKP